MTVVLLHGLGADRAQPLGLFGQLFGPHQQVIAPNVRAHGDSPLLGGPHDFALDGLADEVAAGIAAALSPAHSAPLTIIGISMGAAIAVRIALRQLLPVQRVVFVRPAFASKPLPHNLQAFPLIAQLLHDRGPDAGAVAFRSTAAYVAALAESPRGVAGLLTQFAAPGAAARAIRLMEIPRNRAYTRADELSALAARGVRSLVVGAPRDPVHPLTIAEEWAAGLGSPLEVLPARDDGQRAQTEALRSLVTAWLSSTASPVD